MRLDPGWKWPPCWFCWFCWFLHPSSRFPEETKFMLLMTHESDPSTIKEIENSYFVFTPHPRTFFHCSLFLERGKGGEENIDWLPHMGTCSGMCLGKGLNLKPFSYGMMFQPTEPHWPGQRQRILIEPHCMTRYGGPLCQGVQRTTGSIMGTVFPGKSTCRHAVKIRNVLQIRQDDI